MIIETLQVEKKFGDFSAIRNVSLGVEVGEIVGFVGGITVLLLLLAIVVFRNRDIGG